jgi:hypothetical protein
VFKWWKSNAFQFPLMAEAARDLLAVPSSEVDVIAGELEGSRRDCNTMEK